MAKQREQLGISNEILMSFMDRMEKAVTDIRESVSSVNGRVSGLEVRFDSHEKNEIKKAMLITIIMFMVGIIGGLLGYIWGKENSNERVQERIERPLK